jgi:zinc protease
VNEIPAVPPNVRMVTLENGLVIIVREDHSAPVVSAQAWCQTGSIHEDKWLGAGLSHVLEHMLFKGTTTRPGSRIDQEVQEAGGYMNAYTSFDRTVYHVNVPNTGGKVAIDILCDIMQHATLPADELAKELDVIRREMDMNQDDPGRRAGRRLFECAFTRSPYRHTIIGYPEIFNDLKSEDIVGYYRQRYIPNNMFFVVVGDIKADDAIAQITCAFKGSKARPMPPSVLPAEPKQTGARDIIEEAPIELGHVHVTWHTPDLRHPDMPVIDILAALLGSGRSARLYREVREKKGLVTSIDAWTYNPGEIGLFGASAVVDGSKFTAAREALLAEIERIKNEPVPAEELAKVVKQFVASTLATRKTMHGQAQELGSNWIGTNDLNFSERYIAAIKAVSTDDLQRVARKYFTTDNRTVYALLPQGAAPKAQQSDEIFKDQAIQKITLPNGLRLLVKEDHRLPFVEIRAAFQGGVLAETEANNGICQLMSKMLLQGTARRSAEQIATEIESVGGSIDSFSGNNSFGVSVEVLSSDFDTAMDVFADVMLHPSFPKESFEIERRVQLESIREQRDHLLHSCSRAMRRALFGPTTYGLDSSGNETSVAKLATNDLQHFHKCFAVPNNCVLSIFGDIKLERVKEALTKAFGSWAQNTALNTGIPKTAALKELKRVSETRDKKQAVVVVGFAGLSVKDSDRYALELVQEACSDLGSRLFLRIREELGLAYYCGAQNFVGVAPGYFSFYVGTAPDQVELVEQELLAEAALLREKGLSAEELSRAKAKLIGQKKIARQDLGGYAYTTALDELYGLGYANSDTEDEKYEAVTIQQTKQVAEKYFTPKALVISVVRPN